jgi:hypothetical protein
MLASVLLSKHLGVHAGVAMGPISLICTNSTERAVCSHSHLGGVGEMRPGDETRWVGGTFVLKWTWNEWQVLGLKYHATHHVGSPPKQSTP